MALRSEVPRGNAYSHTMRLSITRRSDLAIQAIRALADHGEGLSGSELARAIGTTRGFAPQIMAPLLRAGWVDSNAGRSGGYHLLAAGREVSVFDVIEAVEGAAVARRPFDSEPVRACVLAPDAACVSAADPERRPCDVHDAWIAAEQRLINALRARRVLSDQGAPAGTPRPATAAVPS
jgi:Rrf2 family protein